MSNLSGYDSEAIGFDSVGLDKRHDTTSSTQTSEFSETGVASQTNLSKDCGSMTTPGDLAEQDHLEGYPPPGLNEFLKRVVPSMMEQLDQNDENPPYNSSDSDDEEVVVAKLLQEIEVSDARGGGGDRSSCVLDLSWSSAGNSLAVAIGQAQHESWCTHDGLVKVYTVKRAAGDQLVHNMDIGEKNCVSTVRFHPSVAALLAYGTAAGEVVLCNLRSPVEDMQLTAPAGRHGSKRVSGLRWAEPPLANTFLTMQINKTGRRRGAADQILMSSGSDGSINVWRVNPDAKLLDCVVTYGVDRSRRTAAPDITCFDFTRACPLRPWDEKVADVFVVGSKSGALHVCKVEDARPISDSAAVDPVREVLDGHPTCVLAVGFSSQTPGLFASVSIDSELRVYDVNQASPLKVMYLEAPVSCVSWLPNTPCVAVVGLAGGGLRVCDTRTGRHVPVDGFGAHGRRPVTGVAINQSGGCRIASGDAEGTVRVWELPLRRIKLSTDDLQF